MVSKYLFLGIILHLLLIATIVNGQCDQKNNKEGIEVNLCNSDVSSFKTIVVDFNAPATLSQYAALILDVDKYLTWQHRAIEASVVKRISKTELYYYSQIETPWPVSNRDLILHLKLWQDSTTKQLYQELISVPGLLPEKEDFVRIPFSKSLLTVTPIDEKNVKVNFVMDIDPGGYVPPLIANLFAASAPWNSFFNFRNRIIEQGENRITIPFIKDFSEKKP